MGHSTNFQELLTKSLIRSIPLTQDYTFKPFDCGNSDLNEFLTVNDMGKDSRAMYKSLIDCLPLK